MPAHLHQRWLLRSATVSVYETRCRPDCADRGDEEWSVSHEIVFPRVGVFIREVGGQRVVADSNTTLFFNGREPYRISHPVPGGDDCTGLSFAPDVLLDALQHYDPAVRERPHRPFAFDHSLTDSATLLLHHRLRRHLADAGQGDLAGDELAIDMLTAVVASAYRGRGFRRRRVPARAATRAAHRDQVRAAKTYVASRFASPISLDEVARAVCSSQYHLARLFRREVGISIHQYQGRLRLGASLERLAAGERSLTDLALDIGYSSHSHFSDAFQRAFGLTPSAFRDKASVARLRQMSTNLIARPTLQP